MPSFSGLEPVLFKNKGSFPIFEITIGIFFSSTRPTMPSPIRYFPFSIFSFVSPCAATMRNSPDKGSRRNTQPLCISRRLPSADMADERFFSRSKDVVRTLLTSRIAVSSLFLRMIKSVFSSICGFINQTIMRNP